MTRKTTLETLDKRLDALTNLVEKGFTKHDEELKDLTESVAVIVTHLATKAETATKEQIIALHARSTRSRPNCALRNATSS